MFRRITSILLALVMVISLLPVQVLAADTEAGADILQTEQEPIVLETDYPGESICEESLPEESTTEESIPEESIPEESIPEESVPEESISEESVPEESIPEESVPEESIPGEMIPQESTPEETGAEDPEKMVPVIVEEFETGNAEELLNSYLMTLFYPERIVTPSSGYMREDLNEVQKYIYDQMEQVLFDIVNRRRDTVDLKIRFNEIGADVQAFTQNQLKVLMYAFSHDHPYEMFWYGGYATYNYVSINELWLWLLPRAQYRPADFDYYENPTVQIDELERALTAVENVDEVVDEFAHYPDYYKLTAYADRICELVEYDYGAPGTADLDINPYTLINIFDGDPNTNVVCNGYAEGYQYLCDRSEFRGDVKCYYGSNDEHAWDIIRIEGKSYLMDVTHCDVGSYAERNKKFMGYGSGSVSEGYLLGNYHYWYNDESLELWGTGADSILHLADTPLDPEDFLVPMTQTDFEAALRSCSGSYYLENSVMLSSSLSLDGIHLTIGPGGKLIVAADTLLKISANGSLRLDYGAVLEIKNGGTVACFGDYSAHDMSTLLNEGRFYADVSGVLAWYAEHCEDMTAQEIRDVLKTMGAETILAAMQEDPSCGQSIAVLEEKAGVSASVTVLDTVSGFPEDPVAVAGAGFNTPDDSGNPICLELGILNGQTESVDAGFSLILKNVKNETNLDFPVQITMKLPNGLTVPGLFLEHRRADGTWERVTFSSPDDSTVQFAAQVLGDFRLYYLTSGSCGTAAVWNFDRTTGELTISGTGSTQDYRNVEDRPWHGLGYAGKIKSISVEEGITRIGNTSFYQIRSAVKLTLPDTLTEIGSSVFLQCQGICELALPENLKVIGTHAFYNCNGLSAVVFPAGITTIGDGAFRYCFGLKHIVFRGDAPEFVKNSSSVGMNFQDVVADAYYPAGNSTWTDEVRQNYGGTLTWKTGCDDGHKIVTIPGKAATCTTAGLTTGEYCSVCGAVLAIQKTIPARGHYTVTDPSVAPTCTESGMTGGSHCADCGEVFVAQRVIDALGHNEVTDIAVDPTCTQVGLTEGAHCGRCNLILVAQTEIAALGHIEVTDKKVDPTCTEDGLTEGNHCDRCGEILTVQQVIPAPGHDRITDVAVDPTCTETGLTEGMHCGRCGEVLTVQISIPALGHDRITDAAVDPTCTEDGLTEGAHCDRCGEVLVSQETVPAKGHSFELQGGYIFCAACGEELFLRISQEYAVLNVGETLTLEISPAEFAEQIEWSVENEDGIVTMVSNVMTAVKPGTAYVKATVTYSETTLTARCRVDVTEVPVEGVQLNTTKATTELYSTDYTDLEILLKLPQNYTMSDSQVEVQDNGIAIDSARFTDEALADLFRISVLDDRRIQIVPTDYAVENPKLVKSKYTGTITVTVQGEEYETDALTLTVKQTKPKLKATVSTFNSFITGQTKTIKVTGGSPTAIYENAAKNTAKATAIPNWLTLEEDSLVLNGNAPKKSVSGQAYLLVETEEWRIPAAVTLSVKNTYKAPVLKLSAKTVTLNTAAKGSAVVTVTANPADYDISDLILRLTDSTGKIDKTGELTVSYENRKVTIGKTDSTKGSYKLYIGAEGLKEVVLTVKTVSANPTVTFKASGNIDHSIPGSAATMTPTFKNYSGSFALAEVTAQDSKKQDVTAFFTAGQNAGRILVTCADNVPTGTYTLTLKLRLADDSEITGTAKVTVKHSVIKLKLSPSRLTLNKLVGDKGSVSVTSTVAGYNLKNPVWQLMDKSGKNPAGGKLDIAFENGTLTIGTNGNTDYGTTYKILVKANETSPAATLTVTIPTEAKSEVTASLKASGKIDVIRDGSAVTVTPTYKNILDPSAVEEELFIYNSQKECVNDLFHIEPNGNGGYTITKAEGAALTAGTYKVKPVAKIGEMPVESNQISLSVTMTAPKLTLKSSNTTLFAKDRNDRAVIWFETKDTALNEIAGVEIKDIKYQDKFEVIDYGNGEFAIGFKGGVDESLIGKTVTLNLNVFIEGNETEKANTTAKVKITVVK